MAYSAWRDPFRPGEPPHIESLMALGAVTVS